MDWSDGRIEIRFILKVMYWCGTIFWRVKIDEPEKKNDKTGQNQIYAWNMNSNNEKRYAINVNKQSEQESYNPDVTNMSLICRV